jgi:hypothetical protein
MSLLTDRYASKIRGTLACFDRIIITGTIPGICYADGMASFLTRRGFLIRDYTRFVEPQREQIRENAEKLARDNQIEIEFIRSQKAFRKEDRIKQIITQRGEHPGLVHIFSAMETCAAFHPWYDKKAGKALLRYKDGKCLHYYFYFIDADYGLCYLRVPTWAPYRLQFYCNGHNWLANKLRKEGISFDQLDNTFVKIGSFSRAQSISDSFSVEPLHRQLDRAANQYCPILHHFGVSYHWSIMQAEYATDIVFYRQQDLQPLYQSLVRTAVHAVKAENVATFLGRKLHPLYQDELGNAFNVRIEGTRIKHRMGPAALKMYDKHAMVLRIETTVNDVSFFKHYREVEHRDGTRETKLAPMQKTIYSLAPLRELLTASNRRYLEFLSELSETGTGIENVHKLSAAVRKNNRTYRGFNPFDPNDLNLLIALSRGEWQISGFQNRLLRQVMPGVSGPQLSRILKRLHVHGLIRKVAHTYKYYLTKLGKRAIVAALKLRELFFIPAMNDLSTT